MDGGSDGRGGRKEEKECAAKCSKGDALLKMSNGEEGRERKKEKEWFGGAGEIQYACWKQAAVTAEMDKASY